MGRRIGSKNGEKVRDVNVIVCDCAVIGMYFILLPIGASVLCHVVGLHVLLLICSWFNIRDKRFWSDTVTARHLE